MQDDNVNGAVDELRTILQQYFDHSKYIAMYPDADRTDRDGSIAVALEHFLDRGIAERRKLPLTAQCDLPLSIAPFLVNSGQGDEAAAIYHSFLDSRGPIYRRRATHPRFQIYAEPGQARLGREYLLLNSPTLRPAGGPPGESFSQSGLWRSALAHSRLETARFTLEDITFLLGISYRYPQPVAGALHATIARQLIETDAEATVAARDLVYTLLIQEQYDAIARIAMFPEIGSQCPVLLRELRLVNLLRIGEAHSLVDLVAATDDPTPFERLLLGIGDLEIIEQEEFPWRGYRCQANFARLDHTISLLKYNHHRSVLLRYLEARLSTFIGRFRRAAAVYDSLMASEPISSFSHTYSMAADNHLVAGEIGESMRLLERLFERYPSAALVKQLSFLRHWLDRDSGLLRWEEHLLRTDAADPGMPVIASAAEARICGAVIADHDFSIALRIKPFFSDPAYPLLKNEHDFVFSLELKNLFLYLTLGDGAAWFERLPLARLSIGKTASIRLQREGRYLYLHIDGNCVNKILLRPGFWLRGDTFVVGYPISPSEPIAATIALRISIQKYPAGRAPRNVTFMSLFWGAEYASMFADMMVPSLCALGELDEIAREFNVRFEVYVPAREAVVIERSLRRLRELPIDVRLYAGFLGNDGVQNEQDIGTYLTDIWLAHEREGCITVMAQPDHVFGRGLRKVLNEFTANQYVVAGHPRVAKEHGFPAITRALALGLINSNADLVRICAREHPHTTFRTGLNSDETWLRAIRTRNGFTVFFKEPPPLVLQVKKDCLAVLTGSPYGKPFEQIDHDVVDLVYRQDRLRVIDDSRAFFWAEMSSDHKSVPTIRNGYWSKAARFLSLTPLHWEDEVSIA